MNMVVQQRVFRPKATINAADIALRIALDFGLDRKTGRALVDAVTREVAVALRDGRCVQLAGFGKFEPRQCNGWSGINPRTNAVMNVPPSLKVKFKSSSNLKRMLDAGPESDLL